MLPPKWNKIASLFNAKCASGWLVHVDLLRPSIERVQSRFLHCSSIGMRTMFLIRYWNVPKATFKCIEGMFLHTSDAYLTKILNCIHDIIIIKAISVRPAHLSRFQIHQANVEYHTKITDKVVHSLCNFGVGVLTSFPHAVARCAKWCCWNSEMGFCSHPYGANNNNNANINFAGE